MTQTQPMNAFNFMTTLFYMNLAMSVAGAVATIHLEVTAPEDISGEDLAADITPVLQALQSLYPKMRVSPELIVKCCNAVAAVLNEERNAGVPKVKPNQIMPKRAGSKED